MDRIAQDTKTAGEKHHFLEYHLKFYNLPWNDYVYPWTN